MTTDEMANAIFEYGTSKHNFFLDTNYKCPKCWSELGYMYMENRRYLFNCMRCKTVHIAEGGSPEDAIQKIAFRLKKLYEWHEDDGECLWWKDSPIEEEPLYCGSPLDSNFPENALYWLPIAGFTTRGMWELVDDR